MLPSSPGQPANVLVVEDEPDVRDAVVCLLELEGFQPLVASNGVEALDALAQHAPPCLILLDLMMPVMDGLELLARLRADRALSRIPVVVTSASTVQPAGADLLLPKPVDFTKLVAVLRAYGGSASAQRCG